MELFQKIDLHKKIQQRENKHFPNNRRGIIVCMFFYNSIPDVFFDAIDQVITHNLCASVNIASFYNKVAAGREKKETTVAKLFQVTAA